MSGAAIVFVHTGGRLPAYAFEALRQAARFTTGQILLVTSSAELKRVEGLGLKSVQGIATEALDDHELLRAFVAVSHSRRSFRKGFWTFTTQRFFYLAALAERLAVESIIHLENDVMLYADAESLEASLGALYPGVAAPFANENMCVPSLVFARQKGAWRSLCEFILLTLREAPRGAYNDMILLAEAGKTSAPNLLGSLPVLPENYSSPLVTSNGLTPENEAMFSRNASVLPWVFDAAALGQYLGGPDPNNFNRRKWHQILLGRPPKKVWPGPGFINPESYINPANFEYEWRTDAKGRRVPWLVHQGQAKPIANLHIHCKQLAAFSSTSISGPEFEPASNHGA